MATPIPSDHEKILRLERLLGANGVTIELEGDPDHGKFLQGEDAMVALDRIGFSLSGGLFEIGDAMNKMKG